MNERDGRLQQRLLQGAAAGIGSIFCPFLSQTAKGDLQSHLSSRDPGHLQDPGSLQGHVIPI